MEDEMNEITYDVQFTEMQLTLLSGMLHTQLEELDERNETGYIGAENYRQQYKEVNDMLDVIDGRLANI
jgi:hypothetical protein